VTTAWTPRTGSWRWSRRTREEEEEEEEEKEEEERGWGVWRCWAAC
jgi:hypothetical protein